MHYALKITLRVHNGNSPLFNGFGNELVSVHLCARDGDEEVTRVHLTRINGNIQHVDVRGTRHLDGLDNLKEF